MRPTSSLPAPTPRENKGGKLRGEPPGGTHPPRTNPSAKRIMPKHTRYR